MNKMIKKIAAIGCGVLMAFGCSACTLDLTSKTAYELAVEQGFQGTELEWLETLKGQDGKNGKDLNINDIYAAAVENGYDKDFLTFLKEYLNLDITEYNDTVTISHNVMSVVRICCGFKGKNSISQGSGVVLDIDKETGSMYVVTNYHVVTDYESQEKNGVASAIYMYPHGELIAYDGATMTDEYGIKATYVGGAADYDLALLKVENNAKVRLSNLEKAELGNSETLSVGEKVYVIGNAEGDGISVTDGVLSVESEYITLGALDNTNRDVDYRVMRTSAAVNHGNSGGALFDAKGKLIGIINAKSVEEDVENIGYALPVNYMMRTINNIFDNGGVVKRAMFGVMVQTVESKSEITENGKIVITERCQIAEAAKYGSAAYGKLMVGDVLKTITLGNKTMQITRRFQVGDFLLDVRLGDSVFLKVERGGQLIDVEIKFNKEKYFTIYD